MPKIGDMLHGKKCDCDGCDSLDTVMMKNGSGDMRSGKKLRQHGVTGALVVPSEELLSETPETNVNVVEVVRPAAEVNMAETPKYTVMTVVLDSGAGVHVMNPRDCKGYPVQPSELAKLGAAFKAANGTTIKNHGQVELNIVVKDSQGNRRPITSKFEAADVTKALWSVGLICDAGLDAKFNAKTATILDTNGKEVMVFHRPNGGLYTAEVEIANPNHPDFRRQGA